MIGRVPLDVAAYCAGLRAHPGEELPWEIIAKSVADLDLGIFTPDEIRIAVCGWCEQTMKEVLDAEDEATEAAELERRRKNAS